MHCKDEATDVPSNLYSKSYTTYTFISVYTTGTKHIPLIRHDIDSSHPTPHPLLNPCLYLGECAPNNGNLVHLVHLRVKVE